MAGKTIKGITIEIDGNATGLDKALKTVNGNAAKLNGELGQVNKLLKFNPSNVTALSQKQELLIKSIENTSNKLQELKNAQSQVEAQYKSGDIGEEQYRAFQREIVSTENSLKSYKSQLSSMQSEQEKLGKNTNRLNTYFEASGKSIDDFSDVLGTRLVNSIKNGTASSDQLEVSLNKIAKEALGAGGDFNKFKTALDGVKNGNSLNDVKQSLSELAPEAGKSEKAIEDMAESTSGSKMMQATEVLSGVGEKVIEIGKAALEAAMDVDSSTSKYNNNFGLTGEEAARTKDKIVDLYKTGLVDSYDEATEALIKTRNQLKNVNEADLGGVTEKALAFSKTFDSDMNESLRGADALMKSYGLSAEQSFDLMTLGAQNGLNKTDELGDNLAEYATLFQEGGYSAEEMFAILQAGLDGGAYNLDKVNDLVKEFGIRMSDGSIDSAVEGLGGNFQNLWAEIKNGNYSSKDAFQMLTGEISNLGTEQEKAAAISAIFGSQGEDAGIKVIESMGQANTVLADSKKAYEEAAGASNKLTEATDTQKVQATWNDFKTTLLEFGTTILTALQPFLQFITDLSKTISGLSEPVKSFIMAFSGALAIVGILAPIVAALMAIPATAIAVAAGIGAAIAAIILIFQNWGAISEWLQGVFAPLEPFFDGIFYAIGVAINALMPVFDVLVSFVQNTINNIVTIFSGIVDIIQGVFIILIGIFTLNGETIGAGVAQVFQGIVSVVGGLLNQLINTITSIVTAIANTFSAVFGGIVSVVSGIFGSIINAILNPVETAKAGIKAAVDAIKGFFSFSISWPKIPMPHFYVNPSGWSIGDLLKGSIPSLGIDWYANGGILTKPTIFGQNGNSLMVGGEAGKEAVAPLSDLMAYVEQAVANQIGNMDANFAQMIQLLMVIASKDPNFYLDSNVITKTVAKNIVRGGY